MCTMYLFLSCNKQNKVEIDSTLKLRVEQTEEGLFLITKTENLYGTSGFQIVFKGKQKQAQIVLKYKHLFSDDAAALQVLSPAFCKMPIMKGAFTEIQLTLELDKKKATGRINFENETPSLTINASDWIEAE